MSMTTTNTLSNNRAPPSSATIQNIQEHDTSLISHVSSDQRGNSDRHRLGNGCGITSASKCFPKHNHNHQQQQHASFGHRLLNKWRKNVLRTSQTHLNNLNDASKTSAASSSLTSHFNSRNRSTTDQNLFIIKDNFVEFIAENDDECTYLNSNETNNNFVEADDMVDLNPDCNNNNNNNNLTIDSKFLRDVNQKLKSIQDDDSSSSDATEIELERLENVDTKKKLSKSPAIFNISQYARPKDDATTITKTDENVKDFFNNEPQMTSSESYGDDDDDDSFSSSSIGENFEEFEKRHRLRSNNKKSSIASSSSSSSSSAASSSTSSLSSVSSVSSFTSSHSSMNVHEQTSLPPQQPAVTLTKNINTRLRNFLPALKLKLKKGGGGSGGGANCSKTKSKNLKEIEEKKQHEQQHEQPITDALLYSFRDRFEIKDKEPETIVETERLEPSSTQDFESFCFIDETSSCTLSSLSSLNVAQDHLATKTSQPEQLRPPTTQSSAFKLLNQVNKKLNLYRIRKQVKTMHSLNTNINNMESVSNKISLNEETSAAIYDNKTIEKIINKENNFVDFNDNNEVNIDNGGYLNIDDDDDNDSVKIIKFCKAKQNTNEINSIARLKINAPLASSEHTTPLSRSIDYLNRLDQFKIVLNNNNFIRAQQIVSSNISETMPIKKYYRLSGGANTTIYNSPNR
jgi:hypothetical protein